VFTLAGDKLPPGRGHGEPLRLMIDLDERVKPVAVFAHRPGRKLLVASKAGYGFVVPEAEVIASKRGGKQVLNVDAQGAGATGGAAAIMDAEGDHVAVMGDNGKVLVFPMEELPEMGRGKGVKLQAYKDGGLRDITVFRKEDGPVWLDPAGRRRAWDDWTDWLGKRAAAGKLAPRGFPKRFR
jgi:topoisomerase-4 subunit A